MKNKFKFLFICLIFLLINSKTISEEFNLKSKNINILEKGNVIEASGNVEIITDNEIFIKSDKSYLNKIDSILIAEYNVIFFDKKKNITINADYIEYNKKKGIAFIKGQSKTILENRYFLNSVDLYLDQNLNKIYSNNLSSLEDDEGNKIDFDKFDFNLNSNILKVVNLNLIDSEKNNFKLKEAAINLTSREVIGQDIKVFFNKSILGNLENDPRIFGNSIYDNPNETVIKKGVFTSCKFRENEKCPPWLIKSQEVKHNKKKKIIEYKNAWLNIYDVPVIYFPYISHPDPSVKRQSGFLLPSIKNSNTLGSSLQIPYYKVISDNKDLTFSPRLFFNDKKLFQTEYRQTNKYTKSIYDHSINLTDQGNNSHFFGNIVKYEQDSSFTLNFETTSDRTYLKKYELKSPLIKNYTNLNSFIGFEKTTEESSFSLNFEVFEDLSKNDSDAYEYVYPNYSFSNNLNTNLDGSLSFSSSGYQKKFETNKYQANIINDLKYDSLSSVNKNGMTNSYSFILKNINSNDKISDNNRDDTKEIFLTSLNFRSSLPLVKQDGDKERFIIPKLLASFSPTPTKNIKDFDNKIDYINLFNDNRINRSDTLEGGESVTLGFDYLVKNENKNELLNFSAGQSFRLNNNPDLPKNSTLGQKRSDIFGKFSITPSDVFNLDYSFALDENLEKTNYNFIETGISVNNFITKFSFLESNKMISEKSYISNETKFNINKNYSLGFSTNKNLDQNLTEYYDIIYEYKNDCLTAALEYKKTFYRDSDIEPAENLFFSIKIIPFGDINSPSIN